MINTPDRDDANIPPNAPNVACGDFANEDDSCAAFDAIVESGGFWSVHKEVNGCSIQNYAFQEAKTYTANGMRFGYRIDRVLVPTNTLIRQGWKHGPIGVELKRSDELFAVPFQQCVDYRRSVFVLPHNFTLYLDLLFVFPYETPTGELASLCSQNRIGNAFINTWDGSLKFYCGNDYRLLTQHKDGKVEVGSFKTFGRKAGAR